MQTIRFPVGAQAVIDGSYYKIGHNNMVFRYNKNEWIRSQKPLNKVQKVIDEQKGKSPLHIMQGFKERYGQ